MRGGGNVSNYVIKLPMQKQIPTLLQALQKHLYKIHSAEAVRIQLRGMLIDELLFKTKRPESGVMGGGGLHHRNDAQ